ncbi:MAG: S1 RNA-binding domain-containing protein, partial [Ilumatobacteraceae bacterium]
PWLFDEGRLIGGKPVPFVGWVFVTRLPVKGPTSRKSQRASRGDDRPTRRTASKAASQPMPVPTAPPPGSRRPNAAAVPVVEIAEAARPAGGPVNDVLPFLDFVERHPMGSSVNGVVESYSSHGAYVSIGDVRGYVPLRLMSDPPPRSAREVMKVQDAVTLVVTSFAPARRSIELAVPEMAPSADVVATPELEALAEAVTPTKRARKSTAEPAAPRKRAARKQVPADESAGVPPAEPPSRQRVSRKKQAAAESPPTVESAPTVPAPVPAKRAATRTKKQAVAATAAATAPVAKKRASAKRAASSGEPTSTSAPPARTKRKAAAGETAAAEARS